MYNNVLQQQLLQQNQLQQQQFLMQQQFHVRMPQMEEFGGSISEDEDDEDKRTLFVANLDERVTEELLYELFLQAGPLESVRIPKDTAGKQRTFGFVEYTHQCSIPYALEIFYGLTLFRRNVTIKTRGGDDRNNYAAKHPELMLQNNPLRQQHNQMLPYNHNGNRNNNRRERDRGYDRGRDREHERDYDRQYVHGQSRHHPSSNRNSNHRYRR